MSFVPENPDFEQVAGMMPELFESLEAFNTVRVVLSHRLGAELSDDGVADMFGDEPGVRELAIEASEAFGNLAVQLFMNGDRDQALRQVVTTWQIDSKQRAEYVQLRADLDDAITMEEEDIEEIVIDVMAEAGDDPEELGDLLGSAYSSILLGEIDEYACLLEEDVCFEADQLGIPTLELEPWDLYGISTKAAAVACRRLSKLKLPVGAENLHVPQETADWN